MAVQSADRALNSVLHILSPPLLLSSYSLLLKRLTRAALHTSTPLEHLLSQGADRRAGRLLSRVWALSAAPRSSSI